MKCFEIKKDTDILEHIKKQALIQRIWKIWKNVKKTWKEFDILEHENNENFGTCK